MVKSSTNLSKTIKKLSKRTKIGLGIGLLAIAGGGGFLVWNAFTPAADTTRYEIAQEQESSETSSSEAVEVQEEEVNAQSEAESTLEQAGKPVTGDDANKVGTLISSMVSWIGSHSKSEVYPSSETSTLLSKTDDLQSVKDYLDQGYSLNADDTKVFESNSKDVLQFTFTMSKKGSKVVYTGNYLKTTGQLQLGTHKVGQ